MKEIIILQVNIGFYINRGNITITILQKLICHKPNQPTSTIYDSYVK